MARPDTIDPGVDITTMGMSARPESLAENLCTTS